MAWLGFLNPALDTIFGPILKLQPLYGIIVLAFIVTLIITLVYKFATDQNLMKQLKDELKELQKEMKDLKSEPEKAMQVQKRAMQTNMKYMMQSMKATLFTFIPIILIFGWVQANYAFDPLEPYQEFLIEAVLEQDGQEITLTVPEKIDLLSSETPEIKAGKATWSLKGPPGDYTLQFDYNDKFYTKKIKIDQAQYEDPVKIINQDGLTTISTNQGKKIILNLFGWKLGWLGSYIIFSIVFSIFLRKWMKVY